MVDWCLFHVYGRVAAVHQAVECFFQTDKKKPERQKASTCILLALGCTSSYNSIVHSRSLYKHSGLLQKLLENLEVVLRLCSSSMTYLLLSSFQTSACMKHCPVIKQGPKVMACTCFNIHKAISTSEWIAACVFDINVEEWRSEEVRTVKDEV